MAKRQYRITKRKSLRLKKTRKYSQKRKTLRRRSMQNKRRLIGGNYERDVTTRTYEGFPMKPLNKVVTSVPGRGVMSVSAYAKLMEDMDRNGNDFYD
jgi:hypothetical protein